MSKKRSVKRFLSLLLACLMILNAPLSALAAEELQIVDMEVLADDGLIGSEDPALFADSTAGGTSENGPFEDTFTSEGAATLEEVGDDLFEDDGLVMDDSLQTTEEPQIPVEEETAGSEEAQTEALTEAESESGSEEELLLVEEEVEPDSLLLAAEEGEETKTADPVPVTVTISNAGNLVMIKKDITVTDYDKDGSLDVDDALYAAHEAAYTGGAAAGYACGTAEYGLSLTKLWGNTSGPFGYWVNDSSCNSLADPIQANDNLVAFIYQDPTWSDAYARFGTAGYTATEGEALTVSVEKAGWDATENNYAFSAFEGAVLTAYDSERNALSQEAYTADGYQVTFQNAGTYYLAASGNESNILVPAVAKVTVEAKSAEKKQYLSSLRVRPLGQLATEIFEPGTNDYEYVLPSNVSNVLIGAALSQDAPKDSTIIVKYHSYSTGKEIEKKITSGMNNYTVATGMAKANCDTITFTVAVGVEGDTQEYKVTVPRSVVIGNVVITDENGIELTAVDGVYYLNDKEVKPVNIKVNAYGASLTINGTPVENNVPYSFTPEFDDAEVCEVTVVASNGSENSVTQIFRIKRYNEGDPVTGKCGTDVTWSLLNGELKISGNGAMSDWTSASNNSPSWKVFADSIRSVVVEKGVTSIGAYAFSDGYPALQSVILPEEGLTGIGAYAFFGLDALKEVNIPEKVASIGNWAFGKCTALEKVTAGALGNYCFANCTSLKTVDIKRSVKIIPEFAFSNCSSLSSIVLPEGIERIENYSFEGCNALTKICLPSTIINLSGYPFKGCTALADITVSEGKYVAKNSVIYTKDMKTLAVCPPAYKGNVNIPSGVTTIGNAAFFYCPGVTEIVMSEGLDTIGEDAFCGCSALVRVKMPDSVTMAGSYAFQDCSALEEMSLSSGLGAISSSMFWNCVNLKKIEIPEKVTSIGGNAFRNCTSLECVTLPAGVSDLGNKGAFYGCTMLSELTVPDGVTQIPQETFYNCKSLEKVVLPAGITSVGNNAFAVTENSLKYVLYKGTPEQWKTISGPKPEPPLWNNTMILYGGSSIGNSEDAPVIVQQPLNKSFVIGEDATDALQISAEKLKEDGSSYYFIWFRNTYNTTAGAQNVLGMSTKDNVSSSCTPATDVKGNYYYYCVVEKTDQSGAVTWTYSDIVSVSVGMENSDFTGSGSADNPYQLGTPEDLVKLKTIVKNGNSMDGIYFMLTADITLPTDWTPIGETIDGSNNIQSGKNLHAFSGILNGNGKTITIPVEGMPLLGYVRGAEVRNLNIYGEKIAGYGLVNNFEGVGLSGSAIIIENVTLKTGSSTLKSGLIGANITTNGFAGCSAGFTAAIKNCTIEKDVVIGYNKDQRMIGSIAGRMQGTIENCVSYATVYGTDYVGGIIGTKDNAMGGCFISNSQFSGKVEASGTHSGGIVGGGYSNATAPNGIRISVNNCFSSGIITGADKVGGILGGDSYVAQAWNSYTLKGNSFTGTVNATDGTSVGGIIGYYDSLNKMDDIANNYFSASCGTEKGIGTVVYVDTNCENHESGSGAAYFNTETDVSGCPVVDGCSWRTGYNRTDDPLGADADMLATSKASTEPVVTELTVAGTYRTQYYMGETFDLKGMEFTAKWSDGSSTNPAAKEITVSDFDTAKRGSQEVTLTYQNVSAKVTVTVLKGAKVTFSLLGDKIHDSDQDGIIHTYAAENLESWVPETVYYVDLNSTVYDVMKAAMKEYGFIIKSRDSQYGIYVYGVVNGEVSLDEFDNGPNSGWMYTVNGIHPEVGVAARYVDDGDAIVFHYTDDYTKEESLMFDKAEAGNAEEMITSLPELANLTAADKEKVAAAREAYEALTAEQKALVSAEALKKLKTAEARMADLTHVHSWDKGTVTKAAACTVAGVKTYKCSCGVTKTEPIPAAGHKFGSWTKVSDATVFATEVQKHTCAVCGYSEKKSAGVKLAAILEIPDKLSSFSMKKGKTEKFTLTMANGDSVSSVTSDNAKYVKVASYDQKGTISLKAVKSGSAKITIRLASGKTRTYTVKVTSGTVKTTKVTVPNTKITLAKGKTLTLKPVLTPFTSTQKITYKSSNKKVAAVTSAGKIKAVAPGTARITVTSGSKKVTVTVTVPGITNVKSSVTVKRNKTLTLKPKLYGISGKVSYTSSNTAVATVDANGKIRGIKKGTVTITLKAGSYSVKCRVKVK